MFLRYLKLESNNYLDTVPFSLGDFFWSDSVYKQILNTEKRIPNSLFKAQ